MSRLGKKPITVPDGVEVVYKDGVISVKGPKGNLSREIHNDINIANENNAVTISIKDNSENGALWGTYFSHVSNMIEGVTKGFSKKLILEGIGYKADVKGKELVCALGFSHPVNLSIPEGLNVVSEKGSITVSGTDKDLVGKFTAYIREQKKPEPYKGKGFRYDGEVIQMKQGKKSV